MAAGTGQGAEIHVVNTMYEHGKSQWTGEVPGRVNR